jgi:hypothetical protein
MKIQRTTCPEGSLLHNSRQANDYADCFEGIISDNENNVNVELVGKAFFSSSPKWIAKIFY